MPAQSLVRAATELRSFGLAWCACGAGLLGATIVLGAAGEYTATEVVSIGVVLVLSIGSVLGGLLLAKRTGPAQLYARILDRAPELPEEVPREAPRATAWRIAAPALLAVVVFTALGPFPVGVILLMTGLAREEVLRELPETAPAVGGAWTVACGVAALRIAWYFERWERARGKVALCLPLRAGLLEQVYGVIMPPKARIADRAEWE